MHILLLFSNFSGLQLMNRCILVTTFCLSQTAPISRIQFLLVSILSQHSLFIISSPSPSGWPKICFISSFSQSWWRDIDLKYLYFPCVWMFSPLSVFHQYWLQCIFFVILWVMLIFSCLIGSLLKLGDVCLPCAISETPSLLLCSNDFSRIVW